MQASTMLRICRLDVLSCANCRRLCVVGDDHAARALLGAGTKPVASGLRTIGLPGSVRSTCALHHFGGAVEKESWSSCELANRGAGLARAWFNAGMNLTAIGTCPWGVVEHGRWDDLAPYIDFGPRPTRPLAAVLTGDHPSWRETAEILFDAGMEAELSDDGWLVPILYVLCKCARLEFINKTLAARGVRMDCGNRSLITLVNAHYTVPCADLC